MSQRMRGDRVRRGRLRHDRARRGRVRNARAAFLLLHSRAGLIALLLIASTARAGAAQVVAPEPARRNDAPASAMDIAVATAASGLGALVGWNLGPHVFGRGTGDDPGLAAGLGGAVIAGTVGAALATDLILGRNGNDAWGAAVIGIIPGTLLGIASAAVSDGSGSAVVVGYSVGQGVFTAVVAAVLD